MEQAPARLLAAALGMLTGPDPVIFPLANVLSNASAHGHISYDSVLSEAGADTEEVLFAAWEYKLLIPRRSAACGEWDFRLLVMRPGEIYEMPNISRYLINNARKTGQWDVNTAVAGLYRDMGESQWEQMPGLIRRLGGRAEGFTISAGAIHSACCSAGICHRTGPLILILKGGGILSPKLSARTAAAKNRFPLYELNPSLYPNMGIASQSSKGGVYHADG